MTPRRTVADLFARIPIVWAAFFALSGALGMGWAGHAVMAEQAALPGVVEGHTAQIERLNARIDTTSMQVRGLAEGQQRVIERIDRLICLMEAEREGAPFFRCEAA